MTSFLSKHTSGDPIPSAQLAYVGRKLKNDLHDLTLRAFMEEGLSQAELAQRLGVDKAQVSRWLGAPGNWTIDTAAKLLFAINGSFISVATIDPDNPSLANFTQPSWMVGKLPPLPATAEGTHTVMATFHPTASIGAHNALTPTSPARAEPPRNIPAIRIAAE